MKEIIRGAEIRANEVKKHKNVNDNRSVIKQELMDTATSLGLTYLIYEKLPGLVVFKRGKKSLFEAHITRKGVTYNCREKDTPADIQHTFVKNYYMPIVIKTSDNYKEVFNILLNLTKEEN